MILNQLIFDVKIINEQNGDLILYIPPQMITGLKMKKTINDIGNLVITLPFNQLVWDSYEIDRLVEVSTINYSTNLLEKEETYFLRKREIYYEDGFKQIAFSCVGLIDLLDRRVVKPTTNDINNAGGFVTRSGNVGDVLEEFSNEQMITPDDSSRQFPNLTYSKISDGDVVGIRTRYQKLIDVFSELRVKGNVSYRIIRQSDNDLVIQVGVLGDDRTYTTNYPTTDFLLFSPNIGNAIDPLFFDDNTKLYNYVYVLGEGEGSNQRILEIVGNGIASSVYNRKEKTVESRKGESSLGSANQQALSVGLKELNKSRSEQGFEFEIIENRLGFRYREDWDIGDYVTFYWEGQQIDFEIKSTTLTVNGSQISRTIELELEQS